MNKPRPDKGRRGTRIHRAGERTGKWENGRIDLKRTMKKAESFCETSESTYRSVWWYVRKRFTSFLVIAVPQNFT
jgi:hypothetical protein